MKSALQKQIEKQKKKSDNETSKLRMLENAERDRQDKKTHQKISKKRKQKLEKLIMELNKFTKGTWYLNYSYEDYGNFVELGYYSNDCGYQSYYSEYMHNTKKLEWLIEHLTSFKEWDNQAKKPTKREQENLSWMKNLFNPDLPQQDYSMVSGN